MTKNPIIKTVVAFSISALSLAQVEATAGCKNCEAVTASFHRTDPNEDGSNKLIRLHSGNGYIVSNTLRDVPFITVSSQLFLEELGKVYLEKCREKKIGEWPFVITQVNKSGDSKEQLQQPTAVRISWIRFGKEELQSQAHLNTLIDALMEMRDKETCLVKFEGKQACFKVLVNDTKIDELHAVAKH
jgi:hypothetical protein